jgi:acetolactate synthase-1/2/3 large subunit
MATRPLLDSPRRTSEGIVQVLEEAGIDAVFGVVGGDTWMLFDALYDRQDTIRVIAVREESVAGIMAEAYGRLTGKPGVVIGQGAFVVAGALMGALEAKLSSSPMLLITDYTDGTPFEDHGPYQSGAAGYGSWDLRKAMEAVTRCTLSAAAPAQAVQAVQLGVKRALTPSPGPVGVLLHQSALRGHVNPDSVPRLYSTSPYLTSAASNVSVTGMAAALRESSRVVIVAGNGVRLATAYEQLEKLAEVLQAPVATTGGGKGVFRETHPLALGPMGTYGTPLANEVISQADTVLVLGSKLNPSDTASETPQLIDAARQMILQVDIDPTHASWTIPADLVAIGDVAVIAAGLLAELETHPPDAERIAIRAAELTKARGEHGWFDVPLSAVDDLPLAPERIVKTLSDVLPADTVITCDAGENRLFMQRFFQCRAANTYLQPTGVGGMGYALPASLASRLAYPCRPVVAVCGDGGFGMSLQALMTSFEQDMPVVVVVLNNNALGWVYHGQRNRPIASELAEFDYAAIARSMRCAGRRVHTSAELADALNEALKSPVTTVIDVVTSREGSTFLDISWPQQIKQS